MILRFVAASSLTGSSFYISVENFQSVCLYFFKMDFGNCGLSEYLSNLVSFLHSIKWMFHVVNTQFVSHDILESNREFIKSLSQIDDLSNFPELKKPQIYHPEWLQSFITQVNRFRIPFETIITDSLKSTPMKKISVKKQYEIENVSRVINSVCKGEVNNLVDFGSGLGYLGHFLYDKYGFDVVGLESSDDRVEKAKERQRKFYPNSCDNVKHFQHFITTDSSDFISEQFEADLAIFGLHGCGDLTVTAINLFLNMERVQQLIFMPCCYHKMSQKDFVTDEFNFFPLSEELRNILKNYSTKFLNRPFLRLAGQQSSSKWKDMTESEHYIHGKNMFERSLAEAILSEDETIKRKNHITFPENRVTMHDIVLKYELHDKSTGKPKDWNDAHQKLFKEFREKNADGEEMSENLFCLQTTIQSICENLVLIDRIRYIQEEGGRRNLKLSISVKKLQNDKLSPRCLILIVEKL